MTPVKSLPLQRDMPKTGHPSLILVVEDEDLVRQSTADFLRMSDFGVVEATTADAAIELLASGAAVDLVFSDVRMPGRHNGFDLAKWINAHRPHLPVLLTSGYAGSAATRDLRQPILAKPYSYDGLLRRITELLPPSGAEAQA
jgi:CheY-like chemotaxis protein